MHGKILKSNIRIINLNHQLQNGIKNLNYLMDHTVWYRSDIQDYFEYILKKHREKTVNLSIKIFTIKTGYYQQEFKTGN